MTHHFATLLEHLNQNLAHINSFLWGYPAIILLLSTGLFCTGMLRGIQFRKLWQGLTLAFGKQSPSHHGAISRFQALATNLSGTIGTGNIAGIAMAVSMGGPGAVFWIWVSAVLGMATKYASCALAIRYRELSPDGAFVGGGPMYTLKNALNRPGLGVFFAVATICACFTTGNAVQANSIASGLDGLIPPHNHWLVGILLSVSVSLVVLGGVKRIGKMASVVMPFMAIFYMIAGITILVLHADRVPSTLLSIFNQALNPHAATGAAMGVALRYGIARGIFSSEGGLGTAPIAHAAALTDSPNHQGLVAMIDPLINTLVVCTITALVILVTMNPHSTELQGAALSAAAFEKGLSPLGWHMHLGGYVVGVSLVFFAYTTVVVWCYYGEQCLRYLLGNHPATLTVYRIAYSLTLIPGAILPMDITWQLADFSNFMMVVPNVLSIFLLAKVVKKISHAHERDDL